MYNKLIIGIGFVAFVFTLTAVKANVDLSADDLLQDYIQTDVRVIRAGEIKKAVIVRNESTYLYQAAAKTATAEFEKKSSNKAIFKNNAPNISSVSKPDQVINKIQPVGHPYLSLMGGISIAEIGKDQSSKAGIKLGYDQYLPNYNRSVVVAYGINGGYEFNLSPKDLLSVGLGVYQNENHICKGKYYYVSNADASHPISDYEYNFKSTRFMFESQLALQFYLSNKVKLIPFISCGVGPSLNYAFNYKEVPIVPSTVVKPGFKSSTTISFSYQLGAGMACSLNDQNRLFATYKYVDLGQAHFDNRVGYSYSLDVGRVAAHEVYFGYTYLFNF